MDASMQTRRPRLCEREVSATQEGIVAVFIPSGEGDESAFERGSSLLTVSDSGDNATDAELKSSFVALDRGNLDHNTKAHNACKSDASARNTGREARRGRTGSDLDHPATTEPVAEEESSKGSSEAAKLVDTGVGRLEERSASLSLDSLVACAVDFDA